MDKEFILTELKRVAAESGTTPGFQRFSQETGIQRSDWLGKYWARWGDAAKEAGLEPNSMNSAMPEAFVLEKYAELATELGHIPTKDEMKLKARQLPGFPSHNVFTRLGSKAEQVRKLAAYCQAHERFAVVLGMCDDVPKRNVKTATDAKEVELGFVYLIKSGRYYKLGKTNSIGRRERDLAIQLPEKLKTVHAIRTDDPSGIEVYWHNRFAPKRMNGEWFNLTADDVAAFRRRKFM